MLDEMIAKVSAKLHITPDQATAGLGILLKFAQGQLGPKFDEIRALVPEVDSVIAKAPAADGLLGAMSGLMGGFGGAGKVAGLANLVGQAQKAGLTKEQLYGVGTQAVEFLQAKGGQAAVVANLLKGLLQ